MPIRHGFIPHKHLKHRWARGLLKECRNDWRDYLKRNRGKSVIKGDSFYWVSIPNWQWPPPMFSPNHRRMKFESGRRKLEYRWKRFGIYVQ